MTACFDIGGSFIRYGVADPDGHVAERGRVATPRDDFGAFAGALRGALSAMEAAPGAQVSIAMAGVFDPDTGRSAVANVPCCSGRPLAADLGAALGRRVRVVNDADAFALAEARLGAGQGHRNVFAIVLGTGVGGGVVLDGALVSGAGGIAGEWGHGPIVDPTAGGRTTRIPPFACGCGQVGCLDAVGGARGLERLERALGGPGRDSGAVLDAWDGGEPLAAETVGLFLAYLSRALSVIVNTLGPSVVPVGGGLAGHARLIAALDREVRALILRRVETPLVVPGRFRADGGLIGAALAAADGRRAAA